MASEFCPIMANEKYPVLAIKNSQPIMLHLGAADFFNRRVGT